MKKILLYCLPLCLLFASCSDLLDEESYSETGKDNYLNNAKEAETVLQGVYKNLANEYTYSYHLSLLFTISTDIAQCEGNSTTSFREIPTNSHNASTSQISRTWQQLYSGDLRCQRLHRDRFGPHGRLGLFGPRTGRHLSGRGPGAACAVLFRTGALVRQCRADDFDGRFAQEGRRSTSSPPRRMSTPISKRT